MSILGNPLQGAPSAPGPSQDQYQVPGAQQLQQNIQQLQQQSIQAPDTSGVDKAYQGQQDYLSYLDDVISGKQPTQAQQQAARDLQQERALVQGSAQSARGVNPALAMREENYAQTTFEARTDAQTAQLAARQRLQAQSDAQNVMSQMAQEQLSKGQLQMSASEANWSHQQALVGDEMALSGMQQTANMNYAHDLYMSQETAKQQYVQAQAAQNAAITRHIAGGLEAVGAVAATVISLGLTPLTGGVSAAGLVGSAALAAKAGSDLTS